jgi:hypothetical protein
MRKEISIAFSLVTTFCTQVFAQELPRFDGVYLGFKDGTFEKLSPFSGQQIIIDNYGATDEATPQLYVPVILDGVALQPEISSATYFDSAGVESIFIRSRTIRLKFVENVVNLRDLYLRNYDLENDPVRRDAYLQRLERDYSGIAGTGCGIEASSMNLLNDSETTYQYFFDESKLLDQNGDDVQLFFAKREGCFVGGAGDGSKSLGLLLTTNSGKFLLLETDAMRNHYPSSVSSGQAALAEGGNDIEGSEEDAGSAHNNNRVHLDNVNGYQTIMSEFTYTFTVPDGFCVITNSNWVSISYEGVQTGEIVSLQGNQMAEFATVRKGDSWNGQVCY